MLNGVPLGGQAARLALVTLTADGRGRFESTGIAAEFPRSDPRRAGQARRLSLHTTGETPGRPFARAVGLYDWHAQQARSFDFGPDHVLDEMVFVPKPGATDERDAWLIGPSINLAAGSSELHVLDVARIEDGPVVSWRSDTVVPAGFHGIWHG